MEARGLSQAEPIKAGGGGGGGGNGGVTPASESRVFFTSISPSGRPSSRPCGSSSEVCKRVRTASPPTQSHRRLKSRLNFQRSLLSSAHRAEHLLAEREAANALKRADDKETDASVVLLLAAHRGCGPTSPSGWHQTPTIC